jgi:hypothetical protein
MRRLRLTPLRLAVAIVLGSLSFAGVAYAASLGLGSSKLFFWNQALTKGTCNQTYTTADDTYVDQNMPSNNFGTAATLGVGGPANKVQEGFIRFDLSGCSLPTTAGADTAALTLFVMGAGNDTISLYPVFSSWSGSTLTWNGVAGLTIGTTATSSFTPATKNTAYTIPVTFDVDAAIKAGAFWGWELVDTSGTKMTVIASAETAMTANRPSMTLSYEK